MLEGGSGERKRVRKEERRKWQRRNKKERHIWKVMDIDMLISLLKQMFDNVYLYQNIVSKLHILSIYTYVYICLLVLLSKAGKKKKGSKGRGKGEKYRG